MKKIISPDNPAIKLARKLQTKNIEIGNGCFLLEGRRSVQEALDRPELVQAVSWRRAGWMTCEFTRGEYLFNDFRLLKSISTTETPQGILRL